MASMLDYPDNITYTARMDSPAELETSKVICRTLWCGENMVYDHTRDIWSCNMCLKSYREGPLGRWIEVYEDEL